MNWQKTVFRINTYLLLLCTMSLMSGCFSYTLEEGRAMLAEAKYDVNIDNLGPAKISGPTIMPLEADALIGTWEGEFEISMAHTGYQNYGVNEYSWKGNILYTFKVDGTFTHVINYSSGMPTEGSGRWRYSNGALNLVETEKSGDYTICKDVNHNLQVYWKNENEIAIRYKTTQDLLNATLDNWKKNSYSSRYCRFWVGYDNKDGSEVVQDFLTDSENDTKGLFGVRKTRQSNLRRAGVRVRQSAMVQKVIPVAILPQPNTPALPSYRIISCERESGSEFVYKFSLELTGNVVDPLQAFLGIKQKLRTYVRDMYAGANNVSDINSIKVDFSDESISDKLISGRAVVLTIAPVALSYDANARLGRLSVRFNVSQYEEARAWARKNIETLARDKNIALVSGEIPPAARFYSLGETLKDGNILEIEFKTE